MDCIGEKSPMQFFILVSQDTVICVIRCYDGPEVVKNYESEVD